MHGCVLDDVILMIVFLWTLIESSRLQPTLARGPPGELFGSVSQVNLPTNSITFRGKQRWGRGYYIVDITELNRNKL